MSDSDYERVAREVAERLYVPLLGAHMDRVKGLNQKIIAAALVCERAEGKEEAMNDIELENKKMKEIIEIIMTQHWDLDACPCWVCKEGRKLDCHPREGYLSKYKRPIVTVKVN